MIDKVLLAQCRKALLKRRASLLELLAAEVDLSPFLEPPQAARWLYAIFLLILRRLHRKNSLLLDRTIAKSTGHPAYRQASVQSLLIAMTALGLSRRLFEWLDREAHVDAAVLQKLSTALHTEIEQVRIQLITAYVDATEYQLKKHEHYMEAIITGSADAIITLDHEYIISSWNQGAEAIYGYRAEAIIGSPITVLIPTELRHEMDEIHARLQTKGVIKNFETIRLTRDGRRINVALTATRIRDADDKPNGIVSVIVRDITEQKEMAQRLERKINGLFIINEIGRALSHTTDLNEILYIVLVGVTAGQALKFNRAFLFLLDDERTHLQGRMAIGPSSPEEAGWIWTDLAARDLTLNDILRLYRVETLEQDTQVNDVVRRIAVSLTETDHVLVQAMTSCASLLVEDASTHPGVPESFSALIGARSFAVVPLHSQEPFGVLLADNLITGKPILAEDIELLEIFAQQASATIENSFLYDVLAGKVRALEEANNNLRLYQEKLLHAGRLAAMGEITATVAHEIRNPLAAMGGFARTLLRQLPPDSPHRETLEIIIREGMRLEGLVTELLDLARPTQIQTEPHDVNRLILECLQILSRDFRNRRVRVEKHLQPDLPHIPLAADPMKQVLLNLLNNAAIAIDREGCITIKTKAVGTSHLEIVIHDTGRGIPEEHLDHIFEPFFTTRPGGSGLGLTVADRIVRDHTGMIEVISPPGAGTTFIIRLPQYQPDPLVTRIPEAHL